MNRYPLFVYGTLMSSQPRHDLLGQVTRRLPAWVTGAALLDLGAYPMLVAGEDRVRGELCWLAGVGYEQRLIRLDRYENVPGGDYVRELWPVHTGEQAEVVVAWLYRGQPRRPYPRIPSGDWAGRD
jgi:gamma-glutamylcyclotransferase (GGCT)/AIG2-like uncharacterized protein YtfP